MSTIKKHIYRTLLACSMLCMLSGCDRQDEPESPANGHPEGVAACFTAQYAADGFSTRGNTAGKTNFEEGDVIHIAASFYIKGTEDEKEKLIEPVQYCAYQYQKNGDWKSVMENNEITWPYNCDFGRFKAYYISGSNGAISEGSEGATRQLSELNETGTTDDTGPMLGTTAPKDLPFGHTVNLVFSHLCTRLSVTELDASTVSEYWFTQDATSFHNAYRLTRDGKQGLKFEWTSQPDNNNSTHIARSLNAGSGNVVTLYLEPGNYSGAKLNYRNNRSYITLNSDNLKKLEANHSYTLDITQDKGIVFDVTDDDGWSNPENPQDIYELENIPAFLEAASQGKPYEEKDTPILQSTRTGVILLRDLDFKKKDPLNDKDFSNALTGLLSLSTAVTFDADFHYIHNSVRPLFNEIQGRLYNLGINGFQIQGRIDTSVDKYGGLSRSVSQSGEIGNVRINDLTLTVDLKKTDDIKAYSIGCVAGLNNGSISDIGVRKNISITVGNETPDDLLNDQVLVGGIIGQNGGTMTGCSDFDNTNPATISVTNTCKSSSSMSTGGIVGFSNGDIDNVTLLVAVDASQSSGSYNYAGGMAGRLRSADNNDVNKKFTNISVNGSVKGGQGSKIANAGNGKSFTGGIAGRLFNFLIENCNALCTVEGWQGEVSTDVRHATGGAFGCIATLNTEELVFRSTWWGDQLTGSPGATTGNSSNTEKTGDGNYIGTFAGIIPIHRSDEGYWGNNNVAKTVSGITFSGIQLDDEDTSSTEPKSHFEK